MPDSPRLRRLRSDQRTLEVLRMESSILDIQTRGTPPDQYVLTFHGRGLWRPEGSPTIEIRDEHVVRVQLGSSYPRMMPDLTWLTPIFHPNISAGGHVCLGGYGTYWVPSVQLDELCHMLWDMIRYENYDMNSPYNREAAQWLKTQREYRFPLDPRPLRDQIEKAEPAQAVRQAAQAAQASRRELERAAAQLLPPTAAPAEVTFLSDVIEGELVEDNVIEADEGITFLS